MPYKQDEYTEILPYISVKITWRRANGESGAFCRKMSLILGETLSLPFGGFSVHAEIVDYHMTAAQIEVQATHANSLIYDGYVLELRTDAPSRAFFAHPREGAYETEVQLELTVRHYTESL